MGHMEYPQKSPLQKHITFFYISYFAMTEMRKDSLTTTGVSLETTEMIRFQCEVLI